MAQQQLRSDVEDAGGPCLAVVDITGSVTSAHRYSL
jgi:hypothetical protein